ncbi:MAG: tetratricopeptide repeat protein [Bacteroidetes bacterium]|nr:tetratricopeptide repeat protein [Bacteroidota bacterium]
MKKYFSIITMFFFCVNVFAQNENALIRSGNKLYKQKKFDKSQEEYKKATEKAPDNAVANYNLGNSQFRNNNFEEAAKSYENSIAHTNEKLTKEKGLYNKGVADIKQKKLEESIRSWKDALKLDPTDREARENLQKALEELKQKQQQQQKKDDKKDQDKKQNQQQNQKNQQQEQPKQPESRLTKKQVEQLLKALQQKENEAQQKMNQNKVKSLAQPDKDW